MFNIEYINLVPCSVEQMFYLVNDINSYSEFIPGCTVSKILEHREGELIAELHIVINGMGKSLITHNFFTKNRDIGIFLVKGPFKSFYGYWEFISITNTMSRVKYISFYEFHSMLTGKMFNYFFQKIYINMVKEFFCRAYKIYDI